MNFKKKLDWINFINLKIVHALEKVHGLAKVFMHFKKYQWFESSSRIWNVHALEKFHGFEKYVHEFEKVHRFEKNSLNLKINSWIFKKPHIGKSPLIWKNIHEFQDS